MALSYCLWGRYHLLSPASHLFRSHSDPSGSAAGARSWQCWLGPQCLALSCQLQSGKDSTVLLFMHFARLPWTVLGTKPTSTGRAHLHHSLSLSQGDVVPGCLGEAPAGRASELRPLQLPWKGCRGIWV